MTKSVIITGASAGLGYALAQEFAKRGFNLGLTARRINQLEYVKSTLNQKYPNINVEVDQLDVRKTNDVVDSIKSLTTKLPEVGIVVANAGITGIRASGKGDFSLDTNIIETNLIGAMATADAATTFFRQQGKGHIVGISSFMGLRGIPGTGAYAASKAGLNTYLRAMRTELLSKHINVTLIHAGFIKTELMDNLEKYPFLMPADKAAKEIVDSILNKSKEVYIPKWPYLPLSKVVHLIPDPIWRKLF
eukprot:NODE_6409_length_888_cov_31.556863_g5816_i0.p1 GENE.NODE_6409_length_888_cov_31.556863_g5816_i0~~NODE_6409_length_888_cov_31.556863_g5816_i0.p1  ORF type:complete len:248 (-),score=46.98 NODE_6409_length_888_cov_31.556863_g5816_i0:89-832(-)